MATTVTLPILYRPAEDARSGLDLGFASGLITLLTVIALAVHGYHPYAEDGGLYMAEIKRLLDPGLYPHGTEFVTGHLHFSLFAPMAAWVVRRSHMSLEMVLFLLYIASLWGTLCAGWLLAAQCYLRRELRAGAVALLAMWITLPVAGTSLMLMDPYVTARSLSTPCVLVALAGVLEMFSQDEPTAGMRWSGLVVCCVALFAAATIHPLMAAYGLGCVLVLVSVLSPVRQVRVWGTTGLCLIAVSIATIMQALAPPESATYLRVAMTRYYWFPGNWHLYEQFGLAAPLIILVIIGFRTSKGGEARIALARMATICGAVAVIVAVLFARQDLATHLVAKLQPLRIFQVVYVVMILIIGAALAERVLQQRFWRWGTAFVLLAGVMLFAERQTFPHSTHLELPWRAPANSWEQAFVWISKNTPKDALFALDAHYITTSGEDAQSFRAIAERSMLPDYSKDGGEASITPALTAAWTTGERAQTGLSVESDAQRVAVLRPLGVTWVVLGRSSRTNFPCIYKNDAVKVCRLPDVVHTK